MQKNKIGKLGLLGLIKCALIGLAISLAGTIILAFVLKFVDISSVTISYINDFIKIVSIFLMIMCVKKQSGEKLLFRALLTGILYSIFAFCVFSVLNGAFVVDLSVVYNLLFAVIVSAIVSVIITVLNRKTV